jgi:hypothetical protein
VCPAGGGIVGVVSPDSWLDRYRAGQRGQVWHELRQAGSAVREPGLAGQAQLVCDEMARRARHNVEVITGRLREAGYRFHANNDAQDPVTPHLPPGDGAQAQADWLVQRFGPVPMTLLSWVRLVGDVWLVGTHPQWDDSAAADPLVIEAEGSHHSAASIRGYFEASHRRWRARPADFPDAGPFVLPLAPDKLHKQNASGGPPYGMILPDGCADGLFVGETTMPFVSYLNWVFQHGGFPWDTDSGDWTTYSGRQWRVWQALTRDLLPL